MFTLYFIAFYVAGLIRNANLTKSGFIPLGLYVEPVIKYADARAPITLGYINGLLLVRDSYSWTGYSLY